MSEDASTARRARRRASFPQVLLGFTVLVHLPSILIFHEASVRLGLPHPWALGALAAAALVLPMRGRLRAVLWDSPRPSWKLLLLDEPYYIHWCATAFGAPILLLGCLLKLAFDLISGAPLALPGSFALGLYLGMLTLGTYAIKIRRRWVALRQHDIFIDGLAPAFEGFRIAQLSDLHIGGLLPRGLDERWVAMSNAQEPDLVVVTGDLVTSGVNFHDQIARVLGKLRARHGAVVSMGNHDYFGEGEPLVSRLREAGLLVLRNDSLLIERDQAALRLAAVDDTWTGRADLRRTLAGPKPAPTVLLAHDPSLFDLAADLGADLVLSGHTHAGQLAMPFFVASLNLARIAYRYTYGLYFKDRSTLYVHAGLGTTGPPARLGAAPELVVFTLRTSSPPGPLSGNSGEGGGQGDGVS